VSELVEGVTAKWEKYPGNGFGVPLLTITKTYGNSEQDSIVLTREEVLSILPVMEEVYPV
jgi:hypothetical protein